MVIKWTNKWSGETGFVKSINKDGKDFVNTINLSEAESFSAAAIKKKITLLESAQPQNTYEGIQSKNEEHAQMLKDVKVGKHTNGPKAAAHAKEVKAVVSGNAEPATVKKPAKKPSAKKAVPKKAVSKKTSPKKTKQSAPAKETKTS